ncbi:hypothetical protein D9613_002229 [Agrocybe pediades]|uniref:Armadillo-like helical domain-containing protein n=1 Tax=Agrocybe pediades TaxID=84607 RepID=A0A8H4R7D5_9AGAR|nr:hypothetical protein D9613_002229 [Agrocybe pediades]
MSNSIETLSVLLTRILAKNLSGWETMEMLAGAVSQSDSVFSEFTETLDGVLGDTNAPAAIRHQVLLLCISYMCGVAQLSTGAYFLRRDFFPSIVSVVKTPDTEQYTFEAVLFLAILANYHKSDAAKLNPYLKKIRETTDGDFMRKLCWASNFTLSTAIQAYQNVQDDRVTATLTTSFGAVVNRLRPDRALSFSTPTSSREEYKDLPPEITVVLLPVQEFLRPNPLFASILMEDLTLEEENSLQGTPLLCTIITLSSYLFVHASSTASTRSIAYANLALNIVLTLVENNMVMEFITQTNIPAIHLCRQRLPVLPPPRRPVQPPICAILDCCVLWLRHNLNKRLEVQAYVNCVWICGRVIWFLQHRRLRLDYYWKELWNSIFGLLNFLASRVGVLHTTGGVELLATETIRLLDYALCFSESYLPTPQSLHEFIYELVRSASVLKKQSELLQTLAGPHSGRNKIEIESKLERLLKVTSFFEDKIGTTLGNAKDAMKKVADEIEANGLQLDEGRSEESPPSHSQDVMDFGRIACGDVVAVLP